MSCPYSDAELDYWDRAYNPMGPPCYKCTEWECEHNANVDNPNIPTWDWSPLGIEQKEEVT